jgi:3-hydroxymyristoyl/3-hydroxydecanoyl-(acyl carrier protein) dehydratase
VADNPRRPEVHGSNRTDKGYRLEFEVPESLVYFEGHFPDFPVVPGVVQVKWVLYYLEDIAGISGDLKGIEVLKFNRMLRPSDQGELEVEVDEESGHVSFEYRGDENLISTGRLDVTIR